MALEIEVQLDIKGESERFWPAFTSFYESSNSGYAIKPKKISKTTNSQQNALEYIAGKSFLFISFKKKKGLALYKVSYIFNGRL